MKSVVTAVLVAATGLSSIIPYAIAQEEPADIAVNEKTYLSCLPYDVALDYFRRKYTGSQFDGAIILWDPEGDTTPLVPDTDGSGYFVFSQQNINRASFICDIENPRYFNVYSMAAELRETE